MTTTVEDVLSVLERRAPLSKAAGWDPVGLQIGDPRAAVRRAAVCHEVTETVVAAVEEHGIDLLVTYHPLLFRPVTALRAGRSPAGRALRLARGEVALGVIHTAYDVAPGGMADALAEALSLTQTTGFAPAWPADSVKIQTFVPEAAADRVATAMANAGAGEIGNYSQCSFRTAGFGTFYAGIGTAPAVGESDALNREPEVRIEMVAPAGRRDRVVGALVAAHPYEEPAYDVFDHAGNAGFIGRLGHLANPETLASFAATVRSTIGGVVRFSGDPEGEVQRVAVVPGAGSEFVGEVAGRADVLVTGDVSHHRARGALDRGVAIVDPGHVAGERPGVARLYAAVAEAVGDALDLTALDASPWNEEEPT